MFGISEVEDKLDKTMNYINGLKFYCEKIKSEKFDKNEIQEVVKYVTISIDNLFFILKNLARIHNSYQNNDNIDNLVIALRDSYIISDKCVKKLMYIQEWYENIEERKWNTNTISIIQNVIDNIDDIIDEIFNYIHC